MMSALAKDDLRGDGGLYRDGAGILMTHSHTHVGGKIVELHQLAIPTAAGHELIMGAVFDNASVLTDNDTVCKVGDKPMSDENGGSASRSSFQRPHHQTLGSGIQTGRGFIHQEDWCIAEDGTRNRQSLLLAA